MAADLLVDLVLLGPKGEQQFARMGFRPYKWQRDIAKWTLTVQESHCVISGCTSAAQTGRPQGWTCADHDALTTRKKS